MPVTDSMASAIKQIKLHGKNKKLGHMQNGDP
jgi:hypothetical protein